MQSVEILPRNPTEEYSSKGSLIHLPSFVAPFETRQNVLLPGVSAMSHLQTPQQTLDPTPRTLRSDLGADAPKATSLVFGGTWLQD